MLKLRDFLHLPQLDPLIHQLTHEENGIILLAGIDVRPESQGQVLNASGLSAMFNILMQEILLSHPMTNALVVAQEGSLLKRAPRQLKGRVRFVEVDHQTSYTDQIAFAARQRPSLLVIDRLDETSIPAVFQAAASGLRILAQFDTVMRGASVARQMMEAGIARNQIQHLRWILTMQRMSVLCNHCRVPVEINEAMQQRIGSQYPHLNPILKEFQAGHSSREAPHFFRAGSCPRCRETGYQGDIAVFDLFRGDPNSADYLSQSSLLRLEEYALRLAALGQVDLNDILDLENEHLRRTYRLLTTSEHALSEANGQLNRRLLELEATNRVLLQRTEALISLQELGQTLISSSDLEHLAEGICRRVSEMCKADRVVLYLRRVSEQGAETAEVLAVRGWDTEARGRKVTPSLVFDGINQEKPLRYMHSPPGVRPVAASPGAVPPGTLNFTGYRIPLMAQENLAGVMIMQSTQRHAFLPGEIAMVQTYANQAALAIQRTGLVEELRKKIEQLEAAQAELVKKERMERELELARQVQQSMLPQQFPEVPGFAISARSEPALQVGGDFYDVILLDGDHFGLVIADVADKGMPAALYMALTRSLLLAEAQRELSPRQALINVNRLLLELGDLNGFVSVFYGVVDQKNRRMVYTRAGHEKPLLLRSASVQQLAGSGMVLGILDGDQLRLSEEVVTLDPGDRLVLYTDGITDSAGNNGEFFGLSRLESLLHSLSDEPPGALCQAVFRHLAELRGTSDPFDDMTMLTLGVM